MTEKPVLTVRPTDRQLAALRAEAELLGISVGELVRRIFDKHLEQREAPHVSESD